MHKPCPGRAAATQLVRSELPSRKVTFPFGSAVKAGEPCRGLAWRGEPESLHVGNLWPRKERADLCMPRCVRLRGPAHRVGRRPPPPGRGGGSMRPLAPPSKPEPERTSHNAARYDPARIVQGDESVGVRIHQRLSVVGRTVEHPSSAGGLDGGSDQYSEARSLVIAERVAFDVPRVQSRRSLARQRRLSAASAADHHDSLRDRPGGNRTRRHAHDYSAARSRRVCSSSIRHASCTTCSTAARTRELGSFCSHLTSPRNRSQTKNPAAHGQTRCSALTRTSASAERSCARTASGPGAQSWRLCFATTAA